MAIINNVEELKQTVRVNQDTLFPNWQIFLNDARDTFLVNYLGFEIVNKLERVDPSSAAAEDEKYIKILLLARRVLGPYAVMLSNDELSINTGSTGHTVIKTDKLTPASDAKIAKASTSQLERAWRNLELLLEHLEENIDDFPEWKKSRYYKNCQTTYFPSAAIFQDTGLIDIDYSRLTFEKLRQLIIRIEKSELKRFLPDAIEKIILDPNEEQKEKAVLLLEKIRAYIGAKVAELHTSSNTRIQRSKHSNLEYKAVIRPLYRDETDNNLNFYTDQAKYWESEIVSMLPELGYDNIGSKMDWSNEGKKIFSAIP
jgi:hypothetical protein